MLSSYQNLRECFEREYGSSGRCDYFFCPGRINLIGEHTDYNGGQVFPAALSKGIFAAARKRADKRVVIVSEQQSGKGTFTIGDASRDTNAWVNYPKGVALMLDEAGLRSCGADIYLRADLPVSAGVSSSAALEVLIGFVLLSLAGEEVERVSLAKLCQRAENRFVGVNCGIMDQFSVALGKKDHAILLDCASLKYRYIPFSINEHALVVLNTNKARELAASKYNERRAECERALELLRVSRPITNLCAATLAEVEALKDDILRRRARHQVTEEERVQQAVKALERHDLQAFGELLNASHHSLKTDYEVTGFELDTIVAAAQGADGCLGARMTGAGFGGCAIALVKESVVGEFSNDVCETYKRKTGLSADAYSCTPGDGVQQLR